MFPNKYEKVKIVRFSPFGFAIHFFPYFHYATDTYRVVIYINQL